MTLLLSTQTLWVLIIILIISISIGDGSSIKQNNDDDQEASSDSGDGDHDHDDDDDRWTVSWNAPFLSSGSGYGSEATSFLQGLHLTLNKNKWNIGAGLAHGDSIDHEYIASLPQDLLNLFENAHSIQQQQLMKLQQMMMMMMNDDDDDRQHHRSKTTSQKNMQKTIFICHSEPGAWSVPTPLYNSGMPCPPSSILSSKQLLSEEGDGDGDHEFNNDDTVLVVVGRTMFETDRLPTGWENRLNNVDEVWVPTHHHKEIFSMGGVTKPIVVVGQGIDIEFWNPDKVKPFDDDNMMERLLLFDDDEEEDDNKSRSNKKKKMKCSKDDYKFLSVFKWEARKGPDILLPSFFRAFPNVGDENDEGGVCLIIVTSLYHQEEQRVLEEIQDYYWSSSSSSSNNNGGKNSYDSHDDSTPRGIILLSGLPLNDLIRLYRSVDAFVLPSRGEGWGRPYMEAMAMGLPVIATNWSGPTEFVNETNGYLLPIQGLVDSNLDAFPNHKWANPDSNELVRLFQHLKANPKEAIEKGRLARRSVVEHWSNVAVSEQVAKHLERLSSAHSRRRSTPPITRSREKDDSSIYDNEKSEL